MASPKDKFQLDSFMDVFNNATEALQVETNDTPFVEIPINKIKRNEANFYSMDGDIESLKHSILSVGLQNPLIVLPQELDGTFTLLSGERRLKAIRALRDEGNSGFDTVYCRIVNPDDLNLPLSREEKINFLIVTANAETREMTPQDIMQQLKILKKTYATLKKNKQPLPGTARPFIARGLGISETQTQRYLTIDKHLLPDIFDLFYQDKVSLNTALTLASLSTSAQQKVYDDYKKSKAEEITAEFVEKISEKEAPKAKKSTGIVYDTELFAETKKVLKSFENYLKNPTVYDNDIGEEIYKLKEDIDKFVYSVTKK